MKWSNSWLTKGQAKTRTQINITNKQTYWFIQKCAKIEKSKGRFPSTYEGGNWSSKT